MIIQGVCFNWDPPISVPKRNMAIQPITEPVSVNPVSKKDCDWLLGSFLFGTEIGGSQLKQTPCILDDFGDFLLPRKESQG